jgi:hypothetical protein
MHVHVQNAIPTLDIASGQVNSSSSCRGNSDAVEGLVKVVGTFKGKSGGENVLPPLLSALLEFHSL